jgi:RHS repeat-associated protein
VAYGYDYAGRMQSMTNWSGFNLANPAGARVTTWNYDGQRGWLNNKVYADGSGPAYAYTPAGRLQTRTWARTDANGNPITTTYGYDNAGGLTNIFYSDTTPSVTNNYDRLGRLTQQVTANYQLNSAYNLAGQLLSESYSAGPLAGLGITNQYDADMRRTNLAIVNSPASLLASTAYSYDAASRLATVADGNGNSATYNYLANSPLVGQIMFKQNNATRMTTSQAYDDLNRLTQIASQPAAAGLPPVAFNYSYNSANQRTQDKLADGSYWVYQYDSLGQVISGHKYFRDGTPVPGQQFDYSFDTIGNRTQTEAGGDQTGGNQRVANYSVNSLNQIISRDFPGTNDIVGAALATNSVTLNGQPAWHKWEYFWGTVTTNNTAAPAWLTATVASGGASNTGSVYLAQTPEQFSYDADGNLLSDGRWTYTWDAENRLIGMAVNTAAGPQYQLTFAYDAKGRRMQKTVSTNGISNTVNFLYDGWNLVGILNSQCALVQSFMWGSDLSGSLQGAGGVGGLLEVSSYGASTTNSFTVFDGNGDIAALVNAADGTSLAGYEYGPFGEVIRSTGPMAKANPFRFSTEYYDDETDLVNYPFRPYSPSQGRFLTRDLKENPALEAHLDSLPGRAFSGKAHHETVGAQGVFFCYNLPAEDAASHEWTDAAGRTSWYLYNFSTSKILDQPEEIHAWIKCSPETPRRVEMTPEGLRTVRLKIETHIKNTYLKQMQAPVGIKPTLKCWMEIN